MGVGRVTKAGLLAALAAAVVLLGGLFPVGTAAADGAVVGTTGLVAGPEEPGKVNLWADGLSEPGLAAWTIDISYNVEYLNVVECVAEHGGVCNPEFGENGHVIRIVGTSVEGITGETVLASITFACKKLGDSHVELKVETFADATPGGPEPVPVKTEGGKALCQEQEPEPKLPGDVDCDGEVGTIDAVLILQAAAGLIDAVECPNNGDLNGDEKSDSLDAAMILQIVAGLID